LAPQTWPNCCIHFPGRANKKWCETANSHQREDCDYLVFIVRQSIAEKTARRLRFGFGCDIDGQHRSLTVAVPIFRFLTGAARLGHTGPFF
jgi:hypothetical protein